MPSINAGTDKFLISVKTFEEVESLRKKLLLVFKLKTIVFVMKNAEDDYSIYISNEWGGLPSDEHLKSALAFVEDQLIEN